MTAVREELLSSRYDAVRRMSYIALDTNAWDIAQTWVDSFGDAVTGYKVGLELFHADGERALDYLISAGKRVFLDMKLHDIPNTVAGALRAICRLPIEMVNVHAAGGRKMMEAARDAVENSTNRPLLVAVTILTSLDDGAVREIGFADGANGMVQRLADLAIHSGMDGVVASAKEARLIRTLCGPAFEIVVPGTRLQGGSLHDQTRSLTPLEAIEAGASRLVIGRAVRDAKDSLSALRIFWDEMNRASALEERTREEGI